MKTSPAIFLEGRRLYLRTLERQDTERCRRWVNDPDVRQYILRQMPVSETAEEDWIKNQPFSAFPTDIHLAIVLKKKDRHIGNMGVHRIDWLNRHATTGAIIGEKDCREKGYGAEAKELVLRYCFDTLGMHRIGSAVLASNPRSLAYLKKSGYREEGRLREQIFRDGKWIDEIQLGILEHEWRAARHTSSK